MAIFVIVCELTLMASAQKIKRKPDNRKARKPDTVVLMKGIFHAI